MRMIGRKIRSYAVRAAAVMLLAVAAGWGAAAQVPGPQGSPYAAPPVPAPENIEALIAPVALYPDELLAVVLQASMQPVQIVQASRFLDKLAKDKSLQPSDQWSEPVRILVNYPEVLRKMSDDLDWTEQLGEAMQSNAGDVLAAVQAFRRRVAAAGNLRSDDKLTVVQDGPAYIIESTNPQVIHVPVYDPQVVVVQQPAPPAPVYVPTPYPAYYDPYPAAAAAATGFFFGALTTAWVMDWNRYDIDEDDIRDFQEYRQQSITQRQQNRQNYASQRQQQRQSGQAQRQQSRQAQQDQRQQGRQENQAARQGRRDERFQGGQAGQLPGRGGSGGRQDLGSVLSGGQAGQRPGVGGGGIQQRPSEGGRFGAGQGGFQPQQRPSAGYGERPGHQLQGGGRPEQRMGGGDAFSYGSGRNAARASDRGAQSRQFSGGGGGGGRQMSAPSGGGRQFSGGGGGRGGGGRGGRR